MTDETNNSQSNQGQSSQSSSSNTGTTSQGADNVPSVEYTIVQKSDTTKDSEYKVNTKD